MNQNVLVLFDLGNVVLHDVSVNEKITSSYNLNPSLFNEEYNKYQKVLMEGTLSPAEYVHHLETLFDTVLPPDLFKRFFTPTVDQQVKEWVTTLQKRGHTVVCATNTFEDHWQVIEDLGVLSLFDRGYPSHLLNRSKPHPLFFQTILDQEHRSPEECYFIDDAKENIECSQQVGINSLWFVDDEISKYEKLQQFLQYL